MKSIWLMGGFGNVLFQILAYRVIKKDSINVNFNKTLTEVNLITKCMRWKIHQQLYTDFIEEEQITKLGIISTLFVVFLANISKKLKIKFNVATFYGGINKFYKPYSTHVFGYFQDTSFLSENLNIFYSLCKDIKKIYGSKSGKVVVHYRKGDSGWAIKYLKYYTKINDLIKEEISEVVIVTDSIEDANQFFSKSHNIKIMKSNNALEDFKILLSAKKLYCAPSTFSWWAAHCLDEASEVIMPSFFDNTLGIYLNGKYIVIE